MRIVLATFLILIPATAFAQSGDAKSRAQTLLGEGLTLYDDGNVAGALEKFEAAYAAYPSPKLHLNIGQANRDLGRPARAMEEFERFLAEAPSASAEAKAEAEKSVSELQGKLGKISVACPVPGASVSVDGRHVGLTPLAKPIWATPGRHQVAVKHTSYGPAVEDVEVAVRSTSAVTIDLLRSAVPTAPMADEKPARRPVMFADIGSEEKPPAEPIYQKKWFWPVVGGAAALTLIIVIVAASSGGGTDVPMTTLGSQRAF